MRFASIIAGLALGGGAFLAAAADAPDLTTVYVTGRGAYLHPLPGLNGTARDLFRQGEGVFRQAWLVAPSDENPRFEGLGPLSNRRSCVACHVGAGRGEAPDAGVRLLSILVRLSVPGKNPQGGPRPEPTYGEQLQPDGIGGVKGEGDATLRWRIVPTRFDDGGTVSLRAPALTIGKLNYGPLAPKTLTSLRMPSSLIGMGLLEAVPDADIEALANTNALNRDGVRGHVNHVWDIAAGRLALGRFGHKANQPTLRQQIASALHGDMGITSTLFPVDDCTPAETACLQAPHGRQPEILPEDLAALAAFVAGLAPPAPRGVDETGAALFRDLGCAACHVPTLTTGDAPALPSAAHRGIHPYTDLLVHDLGEGLADHRPDFEASGREWRTAPLWGIGLARDVSEHTTFLHDGRARDLTEAILWHGGEAKAARDRFAKLPAARREAVIAFLNTL